MSHEFGPLPTNPYVFRPHNSCKERTKGTFLIVVGRCLVCGKPVCLYHAIYQSN